MKYKRFEDLPVWNDAVSLSVSIYDWTKGGSLRGLGDLANQIQRAGLSVSNNIAEGFERGTTNELLHFLYIAKGSAGEVRSILRVIERMERANVQPLIDQAESISRQLAAWAGSLQNSDITGQRHLNNQTRRRYENRQRSDAFWETIQAFRPPIAGQPAEASDSEI